MVRFHDPQPRGLIHRHHVLHWKPETHAEVIHAELVIMAAPTTDPCLIHVNTVAVVTSRHFHPPYAKGGTIPTIYIINKYLANK